MNYLMEKVSYLKGLADGLGFEETTKEGKLLLNIVDTLGEFAEVLEVLAEDQVELEDYVDFIDEDLADLEEDVYGIDDFFEDDYDEDFEFDFIDCCDDDGCCDDEGCCHFEEESID